MGNKYIDITEDAVVHTYNKAPIVLERGEGVYVYDTDGKEYLDFAAGIAVSGLGHGCQELNEAMKEQIDKLWHTSNLYYHEACGDAARGLAKATGLDKVFFCNSGTEAIEGCLKAARKYAYTKGNGRYEFIAMEDSFHGRTMGALAVTGREQYRIPFEPMMPGVSFAKYNDLESVKKLVNEKTCAIVLEPLQGEGGINVADKDFLKGIRQICDDEDILLIFDEIQCGMGRTGSMFMWQQVGVKPDLMAMAKGIGSGMPVGAFAMTDEVAANSLVPGDHGTTYGGNPLACVAVNKTLELYNQKNLVAHVKEVGEYLKKRLEELVSEFDCVIEQKGLGLLQGIAVKEGIGEIISKAREEGLLIISAGSNVLRLVPPLIITCEQIDEMIEKLKKALV
ncbi:aspartate aminotransferase family protein [Lachnospiraceae bacterium OttesenSCG-928-E19]|nr:aspartate aminotransferase family protein [Lachnospiraceae bacterium OttesenSCG-928-E19]